MPSIKKTVAAALASASYATALTSSAAPSYSSSNCMYTIPKLGSFTTTLSYDWSAQGYYYGVTALATGFSASTYTVANNNAPFARRFDAANLGYDFVSSFFGLFSSISAITLTVPGAQTSGPISVAQLTTAYSDILYGSVRTIARVSNVPGTTHGFSFYSSDTQEIDFAFITSDITKTHYTNEQVNATAPATSYVGVAPSDASTAMHEYRTDWAPGWTAFYIDAVLQQNITVNVPSTPGFWLWNNWSNGNTWAAGPPASANTLHIQSITAYWNRTGITSQMSPSYNKACSLSA